MMFFGLAVYAAVYGVTYAYLLHHIVNVIVAWLCLVHAVGSYGGIGKLRKALMGYRGTGRRAKKRP